MSGREVEAAVRRVTVEVRSRRLDAGAVAEHWSALHDGRVDAVEFFARGDLPRGVLPGAFNPLHRGHLEMAATASGLLGGRVGFEISVTNVDKAGIELPEAVRRLTQFPHPSRVWLTRAPTFVEKARLFPGTTFVVGADTIERVASVRYYRDARALADALARFEERGVRFLVFGRAAPPDERGRMPFHGLQDLRLPAALEALCDEVPEERFRVDLSSTELRARGVGP